PPGAPAVDASSDRGLDAHGGIVQSWSEPSGRLFGVASNGPSGFQRRDTERSPPTISYSHRVVKRVVGSGPIFASDSQSPEPMTNSASVTRRSRSNCRGWSLTNDHTYQGRPPTVKAARARGSRRGRQPPHVGLVAQLAPGAAKGLVGRVGERRAPVPHGDEAH